MAYRLIIPQYIEDSATFRNNDYFASFVKLVLALAMKSDSSDVRTKKQWIQYLNPEWNSKNLTRFLRKARKDNLLDSKIDGSSVSITIFNICDYIREAM